MRLPVKCSTLVFSLLFALVSYADATDDLHQLFADEWQSRLDANPTMASQFGNDEAAGDLTDVSLTALEAQDEQRKAFLQRLKAIDRAVLTDEEQVNYDIFQSQLENRIADYRFKSYQMPLTSESSFHSSLASMHRSGQFRTKSDYQNYLSRLEQVSGYMDTQMGHMRAGLASGMTQPQAVIGGYPEAIGVFIKDDPRTTEFYKPFLKMPASISADEAAALQDKAAQIIDAQVMPSYQKFQKFMADEYIPGARKTIGAYSFPDGEAFYAQQIKEYTTLDLTPEEIHQIGRNEVARIRAEMEAIIEQVEFEGTFAEFLEFLRTDERFYAKTPEELMQYARNVSKKMDGELPKLFSHYPRQPYAVNPVPDAIAPNYTTGRYVGAPLESDRPGQYWVNTYALDKRPLYNIEALTLHEAVPGHHFQIALAQEIESQPNFRRYSYISAFGEGWGLYSERLGKEVGFYQDPYSDFGRLTYEMWRAMRLVVDTGMHAMGMSREEAIRLMEENTALSTHNVRTEIDRYISWPGQALSYKLGEIKIRELRAKAEKALGNDFNIRRFHDAVLANGSIPLSVLEKQIDQFIESEQLALKKTEN